MKKSSLGVIVLFFLLYIAPLGVRPIIVPDESRYAEIPREMISSGDWVVPHLNGVRYFEKPVLGYWLNAASIVLFGENAFAIRLPSAIATGLSALMLFFLMRRFAGGYSAGIVAATVFLSCLEVFGVGTFSVLDSAVSMFVTAAMIAFFFAYMEDTTAKKMGLLVLMGIFCGLAFLTKGFIGLAVPVVAIVPFLIWERRWKELFTTPWMAIIGAILVALPWAVMIHLREPDFWNYFFWTEHIKRFLSPIGGQHPEPFWFFIPGLVAGALPWTALFPAAISGVRQAGLRHPALRFAVCWLVFPFVFFSTCSGKLLTYILPCFPPLVILISIGLLKYLKGGKTRAFTAGAVFLAAVTGLVAIMLVLSQFADFAGFRAYGQGEGWKWLLVAVGLLAWSSLLLLAARSADTRRKLALFSSAPVLFMFTAHFVMPNLSIERKAPGEFLLSHANRVRPDSVLVANGLERAVCWFYRRDDVYLLGTGGELSYGLSYDDSGHRRLAAGQLKKLIEDSHGEKEVVLITDTEDYSLYRPLLPKPIFEDIDGRFVFAQF